MLNASNLTTLQPTMGHIMEEIQRMDTIYRKVLIAQATLSTLANITVIALYVCMGRARKRFSNYLLFCTALSDLFVCAVSWYFYYGSLLSMTDSPTLDDVQVAQYGVLDYSFMLCLGTLLVSSLDRWYSVSKPRLHLHVTRHSCSKIIILPIWIISAVPPLIRLGLADFKLENLYSPTDKLFNICFRSILIGLVFIIMMILITTCIKITMVLRRHGNKASTLGDPTSGPTGNENVDTDKRNSRVIKIFIGMIISFGVTFLPITIAMFLHYAGTLDNMNEKDLVALTIFCDIFFFTSSLINPLLTLSLHADYHKPLVSLITCGKRSSFITGNALELHGTTCEVVSDRH